MAEEIQALGLDCLETTTYAKMMIQGEIETIDSILNEVLLSSVVIIADFLLTFRVEQAVIYSTFTTGLSTLTFRGEVLLVVVEWKRGAK